MSDEGGMEFGAWEAGTAFALTGFLADQHADKINSAILEGGLPNQHRDDTPQASRYRPSTKWDLYIGQEPMKRMLRVHIDSARKREEPLPHVLLASGNPGVGKTEMGKLIASEMGSVLTILAPPFNRDQLSRVIEYMDDFDVLLIDEIHKLADNGKRGAEVLLHLLEEGRMHGPSGNDETPKITVVGTTTDLDKLPETVIDRFPIKPPFVDYTLQELALITAKFEGLMKIELPLELTTAIAGACRGTPRVAREMVLAARDLHISTGRHPRPEELLEFVRTDPDGMTDQHKAYVKCLANNFSDYTSGMENLIVMLRQTKQGILRTERFLIEKGYVELTPRGRRLTPSGVRLARQLRS